MPFPDLPDDSDFPDTAADAAHCGGCGIPCAAMQTCAAGMCTPPMAPPTMPPPASG